MSYHWCERSVEYAFALDCLRFVCNFKPSIDVLDVGSGDESQQWLVKFLMQLGFSVTLSDIKPASKDVVYDNISESKFDDESFDVVLCISTLEHVVDYENAVSEMKRIVRWGGIIIGTAPCYWRYNRYAVADVIPNAYRKVGIKSGLCRVFPLPLIQQCWDDKTFELADQRLWRCWTGKSWRDGERVGAVPLQLENWEFTADLIGWCWRKI